METKQLEISAIHAMIFGESEYQNMVFSKCEPNTFTIPEARKAFLIGLSLYNDGKQIDLPIIYSRSDERTQAFIMEAAALGNIVIYDHLRQSLDELSKGLRIRRFLDATKKANEAVQTGDESAMFELSSRIEQIQSSGSSSELVPISTAISDAINKMIHAKESQIVTGFRLFDQYFDGIKPGRLALLAAETGKGKSAFATCFAWNVANQGGVVLYISLEMPCEAISTRILSNVSCVSKPNMQKAMKDYDESTLKEIEAAAELIRTKKIFYRSKGVCTPSLLTNSIKQVKAQCGRCDLVIVDYLQLMQSSSRSDSREREVAAFSRALVQIALSEDTFILALSQVNRQVNMRNSNRLFLSDIRESAAPTQDASGVFCLYIEDGEECHRDIIRMRLDLIKNREDRTGGVTLIFNKPLQRFMDELPDF